MLEKRHVNGVYASRSPGCFGNKTEAFMILAHSLICLCQSHFQDQNIVYQRQRVYCENRHRKKYINNQICMKGLVTHRLCHLFSFLLDGVLYQSPVHPESCSKLVPPGTAVLKTHTVTDGPRSVEAVMTQFRHDPLWRIGRGSLASSSYRQIDETA